MPGKGKTAQGRLWTYVVDDRASGAIGPALVWYKFTLNRSGIHPQSELKSFTGLLQAALNSSGELEAATPRQVCFGQRRSGLAGAAQTR